MVTALVALVPEAVLDKLAIQRYIGAVALGAIPDPFAFFTVLFGSED